MVAEKVWGWPALYKQINRKVFFGLLEKAHKQCLNKRGSGCSGPPQSVALGWPCHSRFPLPSATTSAALDYFLGGGGGGRGGYSFVYFWRVKLFIILPEWGCRSFSLTSTTRRGNTNKCPKMSPTIQTYLFSPPWWRNPSLYPLPRYLSQKLYNHPFSKSPTIQSTWLESVNQYIIKSGHFPFEQKPQLCAIHELLPTVKISLHHCPSVLS